MPRVAHLTSVHPPFDTRIFTKECRALAERGYEVVLIAPHHKDETVDGVRIRAVPKPRNRPERLIRTLHHVWRAARAERAAVYHFHDPELIPVGLLLKLAGHKVVYDVHEDVPAQILAKHWIPRWLRPLIARGTALAEGLGAVWFDHNVIANPPVLHRFPPRSSTLVRNVALPAEMTACGATPYPRRPHHLVYVGGLSRARGLEAMVEAMQRLDERLQARLHLAGTWNPLGLPQDLQRLPGWQRVVEHGQQSRNGVNKLLNEARVGLAVLHPTSSHVNALPTKLFEYMSAAIPVIVSDIAAWAEIVRKADCGLVVDPFDVDAIAEAMRWLLEHPAEAQAMGERGREAMLREYNWDIEQEALLHAYETLLSPQEPG